MPADDDFNPDRPQATQIAALLALVCSLLGCSDTDRLDVESPWFAVQDEQLGLYATYSGWHTGRQRRFTHMEIGPKSLDMIANAQSLIVLSVFLFDNFYADEQPEWDVVEALTTAIIDKLRARPGITVALVLDPSNRAYSDRVAPAVARLREAGADIFYSDLLTTQAHTPFKIIEAAHHVARWLSQATGGVFDPLVKRLLSAIKIPFVDTFDGHAANLRMALTAALVKANHRKILVVDGPDGHEALISSANPHNASVNSTNYAVSVSGALASYILDVQRRDIAHSIALDGSDYALWHSGASAAYQRHYLEQRLPKPAYDAAPGPAEQRGRARARFVSESAISSAVLSILRDCKPDDEIRIQMFYLSDFAIIDALMHAARRARQPVKLLLDPNNDAFGRSKDGTPNRQVAALLMGRIDERESKKLAPIFPAHFEQGVLAPLNLEIRWFDTHGEQNHAKIISVTNAQTGKFVLFHGSANWTGKNLRGINMEANIQVEGSRPLVRQFNDHFERFYQNTSDARFSQPYDYPAYRRHSGLSKWLRGEKFGFVAW